MKRSPGLDCNAQRRFIVMENDRGPEAGPNFSPFGKGGSRLGLAVLTLYRGTATIEDQPRAPALYYRPRRLAWPRTSPFHGGNTGSNPVGDAKSYQGLSRNGSFSRRHKKEHL